MGLTDAQKAYTQIKEKIITTEMRPGTVIREAGLMEELNLGRTPIREALKQLEAERLVVVSPRRGMFVADVAITDLLNVHEIRLEMDALCARLAVERVTPAQLAELRELVRIYQECDECDPDRLMALDRRLHHLIGEAAGNRLLYDQFEVFYNLSVRIWYLYLPRLQPEDLDIGAFEEILAAIECHDPARADLAMRRHIRHFQDSIRQQI